MGGWTLFLCAAIIGALIIIASDWNRRRHEQVYMERMRRSMLFYEIFPLIAEARQHDIDRVQIERSRIVFYAVCPPGEVGSYVLSERGHRPLNPQRVWALTQAVAEELPVLREGRCYRLKRYTVMRPNGKKDDAYQFIIRNAYKAQCLYARQRKPRLY